MASYFDPAGTEQPPQDMPFDFSGLVGQWNEFLSDPRGRGALLSAGLTMMQPRGFGDTASGQIGRAIGTGGETIGRAEAMDLKEREADSKQELRGAQATSAESRARAAEAAAGAAGSRSEASTARLDLARQREENVGLRNRAGNQIRVQRLYAEERRAHDRNQALSRTPQPFPEYDVWLQGRPHLADALRTGAPIDPVGTPAPRGSEGGDTPPASGAPSTSAAPPAPTNPTARTANTVYRTPRGDMRWTGTGWVSP